MAPSGRGAVRRVGAAALALGLAFAAAAARAAAEPAESPWARSDEAQVRLVSAVTGTGEAGAFRAGLQFELQPGWKTYWRSPGDAGLPVTVDWTGSENLAGADMAWPAPHRFSLFGLDTFGYEREVVFPLAITAERPAAPVRLKAHVSYLVCKEICVPHTADLDLSVPGGPAAPSPHLQLIDRYLSQVPGDGAAHGLGLDSVAIGGAAAAPVLEVVARSALPFQRPDLIVEGPPGLH
ncbi:MAG: hypothetical protein IRY94_06425, partial [Rhodospirillaceae bacterium]|nr:hypothetical protein [Rhodospirillaceae bacterium]